MGKRTLLWGAGAAVLLLLLGFWGWQRGWLPTEPAARPERAGEEMRQWPLPGYAAPGVTVRSLDGREVRLADLRGRNVVLNFWATWCPACREELPAFQKVYHQARQEGWNATFLLVDVGEEQSAVEEFLRRTGLDLPVYLDREGKAAQEYLVRGIPTTFFIDTKGDIRDRVLGAMTEEQLRIRLEGMLKQ